MAEKSPRPEASRSAAIERSLASYEAISHTEAAAFAVRFAADYLSWDEEEPARRSAALRAYLSDPALVDLGWSGSGRQRADLVVPGRTVDYRGAVVVEVTARVVLYHPVSVPDADTWRPPAGAAPPPLAFAPSSAPAPTANGWEPGAAWWVRIAPPVRRAPDDGRLVVDFALDIAATS